MQKDFLPFQASAKLVTAKRRYRLAEGLIALSVTASEEAIVSCTIVPPDEKSDDRGANLPAVLGQALQELDEYFWGERMWFSVPLALDGTDFQRQVWQATCQVPYGQVRSYWWVAVRMGNPYAMRAVGNALGANPLAIFVPCHRVVRQDGSLGGFRPGVSWKELLLAHEARFKEELYRKHWPSEPSD